MTNTTIKKTLTSHFDGHMGRTNFVDGRQRLFLCGEGVRKFWSVPETVKKIEVTLSTREPKANRNAHKFRLIGNSDPYSIDICPLPDENWARAHNDTYIQFDFFTREFIERSNQRHGWIQIHILEDAT